LCCIISFSQLKESYFESFCVGGTAQAQIRFFQNCGNIYVL
jgi:hypothetical protein